MMQKYIALGMIALFLISLHWCWFAGVDPTGAHSTSANSTGAYSTGADPTGAHSTGADSTGGNSTGANSIGADLTGANSTSVDSTGADSPVRRTVCVCISQKLAPAEKK